MKQQPTSQPNAQNQTSDAIVNYKKNTPAIFDFINNPPVLLYSSPVAGMALFFISAVSSLSLSFFKTITRLFSSLHS